MSTLKNYIITSYGASVYKNTLQLKEAKKNMAKSKNQFIFLQRCVKHKIIPKSMKLNCPIRNAKTENIMNRYRFEILIATKNDAKHRFFNNVKVGKDIENELSAVLSEADMAVITNVTEKARESMFVRSKEKLVNKFSILKKRKDDKETYTDNTNTLHMKEPILNLASSEIPEHHKELLELGPKFVPHVKSIPYMDIVSATESSALKLEYSKKVNQAENLRKDVLRILKMAKPVKDNLNARQRLALKEIRNDEEVNIYPFDKGAGLVRLERENAISKIREQIGETQIIDVDPTKKLATDIRKVLSILNKKRKFTKKEYQKLYPSDPIPPRMYGAVKAHKPEKDYPMRIVVSTIGTPSYGISQYLVNIIQQTLNKNEIRIINSQSFVRKISNWDISPDEIQVSYDVVNLYPSVPLKEATTVILDLLNSDTELKKRTKLNIKEIKSLIEICLSKCYFLWNNEIHELQDSGPIGLSLMVVIAEGFLQVLEAKALNDALYHQPQINVLSFYRYVDDSHARFDDRHSAESFKEVLNSQHEKIQYTIDYEKENKELDFLDIKIINNCEGKYEFNIHRKDAITNVQVKPNSSHDPNILKGIFKGFVHRAITICSEKYINDELNFLKCVFVENGYKENDLCKVIEEVRRKLSQPPVDITSNNQNDHNQNNQNQTITLPWIPGVSPKLKKAYKKSGYKVVFKSNRNLKTILTAKNKTTLPKNSYPGVYKIPCSCGITPYRGETKKKVSTRSMEHEESIRKEKWDNSGVVYHSNKCSGNIQFENTETVKVIYNKFDRKVRESLEMQKHGCHSRNGGMNLDDGQYVKTKFWVPFFHYLVNNEKK